MRKFLVLVLVLSLLLLNFACSDDNSGSSPGFTCDSTETAPENANGDFAAVIIAGNRSLCSDVGANIDGTFDGDAFDLSNDGTDCEPIENGTFVYSSSGAAGLIDATRIYPSAGDSTLRFCVEDITVDGEATIYSGNYFMTVPEDGSTGWGTYTLTQSSGGSMPAGTCNYTNAFSFEPECKEYAGSAWTQTSADENCQAGQVGADPGTWSENLLCEVDPTLGWCAVPDSDGLEYVIQIGGSNPADCGTAAGNCAGFLQGVFTPSSICPP